MSFAHRRRRAGQVPLKTGIRPVSGEHAYGGLLVAFVLRCERMRAPQQTAQPMLTASNRAQCRQVSGGVEITILSQWADEFLHHAEAAGHGKGSVTCTLAGHVAVLVGFQTWKRSRRFVRVGPLAS